MPRNAKVNPQSGSHHRPGPESGSHQQKASEQQPGPNVHPYEPEDAYLTGTSRSLQRRVLGLNVDRHGENAHAGESGRQAEPHPQQAPGQHATGSFTQEEPERRKKTA